MTRLYIATRFVGPDKGEGGVRRVVEGQRAFLPAAGIEIVETPGEADVLCSHITCPSDLFGAKYSDKPLIAHNHGFYWEEVKSNDGTPAWAGWGARENAHVMRLTLAADIVTAPTEWVAQAIRRNTNRDVRVVPHGLDLDDWQVTPAREGEPYVLWNKSRPDAVCDPTPVARLAAMLPDVHFITTFWPEGVAPAPNVEVVGKMPHGDARALVEGASVYLATARETGQGIGTLEALACGVPVVGWDFGGQTETITHNADGWLAEPDDYDSLAHGIRQALVARADWQKGSATLGHNPARAKAEQYPWSRAAEMYAEIYREALERRKGPKVSVIVPAYKMESYLRDTLASVLGQDQSGFTDWECVVVDDASPDGCGAIADEFAAADSRFVVVHNERNLYLAGARNAGVERSRGRYIMPLDADDMLGPGALKTLSQGLDDDREIHIAYGGVFFLEPDGRTPTNYGTGTPGLSRWPIPFEFGKQISPPRAKGERPMNLLPYASMIRREALTLTGGWRSRRRTAEDADLWCRLASYGFNPKIVSKDPTLYYRNRPDSMSRMLRPDDWTAWYPWSRLPSIAPGACPKSREASVVYSFDPAEISVIIPVGPGHAQYLIDAVDSVDAQTFRDWECIVINDTGEPLPTLPPWVVVVDQEDQETDLDGRPTSKPYPARFGSVAKARNAGIAAARAPLFLPLDADDVLAPNCLKEMYAAWVDTHRVVYSDFYHDRVEPGVFTIERVADFEEGILQKVMLGAVTQLTPVAWHADVGGYDETMPGWEDWALQLALCEAGHCFERVALPLWTYRKHTGTLRERFYTDGRPEVKEAMLKRFPGLWPAAERELGIPTQGRTIMACNSCAGSRRPPPPAAPRVSSEGAAPEGALKIKYVGDRQAEISYKGKSGTVYDFARGTEKYVHAQDAAKFLERDDFIEIPPLPPAPPAPVLAVPAAAGGEIFGNGAGPVPEPEQVRAAAQARVEARKAATAPAQSAAQKRRERAMAAADAGEDSPMGPGEGAPAAAAANADAGPGKPLEGTDALAKRKAKAAKGAPEHVAAAIE